MINALSILLALLLFFLVAYLLVLYGFKLDIRKYNTMMPEHYQIPYPTTFKELLSEFRKYNKLMWLLRYQMYQYHEYITDEDNSDE